MQTRLQKAVEILNRHKYQGSAAWVVAGICGQYAINEKSETLTMYQAFEIAAQLECGSGIKFGQDV